MGGMVSVEVPEELVSFVQAVVGVVSRFSAPTSVRDFAAAEAELGERVAELECAGQRSMLISLDEAAPRVQALGKTWRRLSLVNEETYFALRGPVRLPRALYREEGVRNGPTICPMELRAGIVEGVLTPAAARGVAHVCQAMPSREADEVLTSLAVLPFSRSTLFREATAVGSRWVQQEPELADALAKAMDISDKARCIALSVDRASMPMAEPRERTADDIKRGVERPIAVNFRMAYTACWTLCDEYGKALTCVRYSHVAEQGSDAIEVLLRRDLDAIMERAPTLKIVTLADGAPEMQNILDRVVAGRPVAARLIDFWHLAEHLSEALKSVNRDVSPTLSAWKGYLVEYHYGVETVAAQLRDIARTCNGPPPKAVTEALTYIDNNQERMRYATAMSQGLPVGSGHVEATGKSIIETRMKRSGSRWHNDGAQALLSLRALAKSSPERWIRGIGHVLSAYKADVAPLGPKP